MNLTVCEHCHGAGCRDCHRLLISELTQECADRGKRIADLEHALATERAKVERYEEVERRGRALVAAAEAAVNDAGVPWDVADALREQETLASVTAERDELRAKVERVARVRVCLCCRPGCECGNYADPCALCEAREAVGMPAAYCKPSE